MLPILLLLELLLHYGEVKCCSNFALGVGVMLGVMLPILLPWM